MNWCEIFSYKDGHLYWIKTGQRRTLSKPAGTLNNAGYIVVRTNDKNYCVHRIIWEMHNGEIHNGLQIDHIDRNKSNNYIENLRLATHQQNSQNKVSRGFHWYKPTQKWRVEIKNNDRKKHIGYYDTIIDARAAYLRARREHFGEFA